MSINLEPEDARILLSIENLRVRIAGVDVVDDVSLFAPGQHSRHRRRKRLW